MKLKKKDRNKTEKNMGMRQGVYRNETRKPWNEAGRLQE